METNNIKELVKNLKGDQNLQAQFLQNPITFLENIEEEKPINDKGIFLTIIVIVGVVLLSAIVLGTIIIFRAPDSQSAKVPEFLVAIGSTALGALVGLLSPSPTAKQS